MRAGISSSSIATRRRQLERRRDVSLEHWHRLTSSLGWTLAPSEARPTRGARRPRSCSCWSRCRSPSGRRRSGTARRGGRRRPRGRRRRSPRAFGASSRPRPAVGLGGGELDQRERAQEAARHRLARDREVEDGALRRGAVQGVGRDLHLAHRVALDAGRRVDAAAGLAVHGADGSDAVGFGRPQAAWSRPRLGRRAPGSGGPRCAVERPGRVRDEHDQLAVRADGRVRDPARSGARRASASA